MRSFSANDLINVADAASDVPTRSRPKVSTPSLIFGKSGKPQNMHTDSFASLADLVRAKPSWAATSPPVSSSAVSPMPAIFEKVSSRRRNSNLASPMAAIIERRDQTPRSPLVENSRNECAFSLLAVDEPDRRQAVPLRTVSMATGPIDINPSSGQQDRENEQTNGDVSVGAASQDHKAANERLDYERSSGAQVGLSDVYSEKVIYFPETWIPAPLSREVERELESEYPGLIRVDSEPMKEPAASKLSVSDQQVVELEQQLSAVQMEHQAAQATIAPMQQGVEYEQLCELRFRLDTVREHNCALTHEKEQNDAQVKKLELVIEALRDELMASLPNEPVGEPEDLQQQQQASHQAELASLRESATAEMEALATQSKKELSKCNAEIARLKGAVALVEVKSSDHQLRAQNLADTQIIREKKLALAEQKLQASEDEKLRLQDKLDQLQSAIRPLQGRVKELESQLHEKTTVCDRMRNDLHHSSKRLDLTTKALHKVENFDQLKGAAHLIVPSAKTTLPKKVLSCMECFTKNLDCDDHSRCQNCVQNDNKCVRWRCSVKHILLDCRQQPCNLYHDVNGWLMLRGDRNQW